MFKYHEKLQISLKFQEKFFHFFLTMLIDLRVSSVPVNFLRGNLSVIELCSILLVFSCLYTYSFLGFLGIFPIILGFAAWNEGWETLLFLMMKISII